MANVIEVIIRQSSHGTAVQDASKALGGLKGAASGVSGILGGVGGALGGMAKVAGGIIAANVFGKIAEGIVAVPTALFGFNNAMEQASARIFAFTKDAGKTADILETVEQRAAKTPFAFNEMASAAASLMPAIKMSGESLEGLLEKAEILAASNPLEGLSGASFSLKEAISGDFTSIIERFNLSRVTINKLKDQGVPALEIVQQAMAELGLDTDLVTNLANTAEGRWSTFKDTLVSLGAEVTKPIFEKFSKSLGVINEMLAKNAPAFEAFAGVLAGKVSEGIERIGELVGKFQDFGPGGLFAALGFEGGALFFKKLSELMTMITGETGTLAETIQGALGSALSWLATNLFPTLSQGLQFVMDHFEEFKGALMGIGGVLAVGALAGVAAAILSLLTPINLIIAGAALLGAAWAGNWGGIQEKTFAAWAVLQPLLAELMTWLQINLPIAVQFLSEVWNTILLPALLAVAEFITGTYIPMWLSLYEWLYVNIPLAIQTLSDFWTNTLQPAVAVVMDYVTTVAIPFWQALANLFTAVVGVAVKVLAGLWQNILRPALVTIIGLIAENLRPGFEDIAKIINENVSPAAETLGGEILPALSKGLETVVKWIKDATGFFNGLATAVKNFTLPDVLTPGSPPPMALALQDIANAAQAAGAGMLNFNQATIDALLGINRGIVSVNDAIGQARDVVEDFLETTIEHNKAKRALTIMGQVFRDNSDTILTATDRAAKFRELLSKINFGVNSQQQAAIMGNGVQIWLREFDKNIEKMKVAQQKMFAEAGRTALDIGNRLNDIVSASIDVLDTRVETLQELIASGLAEVNFEGEIISALEAQELLNIALQEQRDIQDDILQLKQNEQKLGFLEKQLSLVETLTEAGLNIEDILGGMTLGLDASIPDMIAATNALVQAMIEQVNKDLQLASPSKVMFKMFQQVGAGAVQGLLSMKPMLEKAIGPVLDPLMTMGNDTAGGVTNTKNYYFNQTVNTRAESSTVIGDFRTAQMLLGA